MSSSRLLNALILVILLLATASMPVASAPAVEGSPAKTLDKIETLVLEEMATRGHTEFFVWMIEKADLSLAGQLQTKQEKGRFVFNALVETAERTQKDLRAQLDAQGVDYQAFYIANKILVRGGGQALVMDLAARGDVARITANHQFQLQEPFREQPALAEITAIEPNITFINADDVWAMGVTGQNTVLAGNDTGLDETHPAITPHYRGCLNPPTCTSWDHNYNWWDATGTYPTNPYDGHGHGTHTTGTMVGDDGGSNQIGVAPGAQTIHCKNMTNRGGGSDATFTECFQWDLAPWNLNGQNPNPDLAPDAVNNSWGYAGGGDNVFRDEIQALHAAGILVEVSAGNEGPACQTLRSPGDYWEVLTTGSVNHAAAYPGTLTSFSSRGPSKLDAGYFPDIMAPGESIRSSLPRNRYAYWSGTSMAGPHATALVGLIWSACPSLAGQVAATIQIIQDTAVPLTGQGGSSCSGDYVNGPNNDWGLGTINALAAVQACGNPPPSVSITNPAEGSIVSGMVLIQIDATDAEDPPGDLTVEWNVDAGAWQSAAYNGGTGYYEASWDSTLVGDGSHTINARATDSDSNTGSDSNSVTVDNGVSLGTMYVSDIAMSGKRAGPNRSATAVVTIHDTGGNPVAGVTVYGTWSGDYSGSASGVTGIDGTATFRSGSVKKANAIFAFAVDNVVLTGWIYDPALNVETSDTITVP